MISFLVYAYKKASTSSPFPPTPTLESCPKAASIARRSSSFHHRLHLLPVDAVVPRTSLLLHPSPRCLAHLLDVTRLFFVQPNDRSTDLAGGRRSKLDAPPQDASSVDAKATNDSPASRRVP